MNDNFNRQLERSGLSMYALAKRASVPYTTVNEIRNGKIDINQCAAATVCRLGDALGSDPRELMNEMRERGGAGGQGS